MARKRWMTGISLAALMIASFAFGFVTGEKTPLPTETTATDDTTGAVTIIPAASPIVQQAAASTVEPTATETVTPVATATPSLTPTDGPSPTHTSTPMLTAYTVQRGDNLYRIAERYNVPMELIVASNNLPNPSSIEIGQSIVIPLNGVAPPTPTPTASLTIVPSLTAEPVAEFQLMTIGNQPGAIMLSRPVSLRDMRVELFLVMPPEVQENVRLIYAKGLALGRNPHAFSKVGDSTIEPPHFLTRFDTGYYNLGTFAYLQDVIDYYAGSFGREGLAIRRGLHTWALNDSLWADPLLCLPGEGLVACELRVNNPSVVFFRMGSNDVGRPDKFEENMRTVIEYCINEGVIPIIGTKADRHDGHNSPNNAILRRLAAEYRVPLWDFDTVANIIPDRGLGPDNVHMTTFYAHDWTSPVAFERGHGVHNLTALMMLDLIMQTVNSTPSQDTNIAEASASDTGG